MATLLRTLRTEMCRLCHATGRPPSKRPAEYGAKDAWAAKRQPHLSARACQICDGTGFIVHLEIARG
jgi:hypothetical protein